MDNVLAQMCTNCMYEVSVLRSQLDVAQRQTCALESRVAEMCEIITASGQGSGFLHAHAVGGFQPNQALRSNQALSTNLDGSLPSTAKADVNPGLTPPGVEYQDVAQVRQAAAAIRNRTAECQVSVAEQSRMAPFFPYATDHSEMEPPEGDWDTRDGDWEDDGDDEKSPRKRTADVIEHQFSFIECFREELLSPRPLLLSQLNNLYKMRGGSDLHYKEYGYDKLRDFLLDIPGLVLCGRGNKMHVKLGDRVKLESFQSDWAGCLAAGAACAGPQFRMPKPLPELVLRRLYDFFLRSEGCEVPLRSFLKVWTTTFPGEPLPYRALGFRDVRGLLSQVPFLEKVGHKANAKYVLTQPDAFHSLLEASSRFKLTDAVPTNTVEPLQPGQVSLSALCQEHNDAAHSRFEVATGFDTSTVDAAEATDDLERPVAPEFSVQNLQPGVFNSNRLDMPPTQIDAETPAEDVPTSAASSVSRRRGKKNMSLYVSSPGAFSSDSRDAAVQQGKFDMCSVLKMRLVKGQPGLVCDISGGRVVLTNSECDALFEVDDEASMTERDVFSLIHEDDRHAFSSSFAYAMLSEKSNMNPNNFRIVTMAGRIRLVRIEGSQLVGMWWQLQFLPDTIDESGGNELLKSLNREF